MLKHFADSGQLMVVKQLSGGSCEASLAVGVKDV